jgi:hypothetical protein
MHSGAQRLRVSLPLLAPKPAGRRVRRILRLIRDLMRAAEGELALERIASVLDRRLPPRASPEIAALAHALRGARGRARRRLVGDLLDLRIARLRRDLRALVERGAAPSSTVEARLREAMARRWSRAVEALDAASGALDPARGQRALRQLRRLHFTAELRDALRGRIWDPSGPGREAEDRLGSLLDAFAVADWLARRAVRARAAGDEALTRRARLERRRALELARARWRELPGLGIRALLAAGDSGPQPADARASRQCRRDAVSFDSARRRRSSRAGS